MGLQTGPRKPKVVLDSAVFQMEFLKEMVKFTQLCVPLENVMNQDTMAFGFLMFLTLSQLQNSKVVTSAMVRKGKNSVEMGFKIGWVCILA